jgi:8-oxo-dGTP pyrophosphatase MutT (NUDIX family)
VDEILAARMRVSMSSAKALNVATSIPSKACPVVMRHSNAATEILAFEHPHAGLQIVKGTIDPGESPAAAALRELEEESGIRATEVHEIGAWNSNHKGQIWWFGLVHVATPLLDNWVHETHDDGGHQFRFFWQRLHADLDDRWHPVFRRAIGFIRSASMHAIGVSE